MNEIGLLLLEWHKDINRDLPWKETDDPFFIWLSEIILQQTRVAQGLPYYQKFTQLFPTVFDLADASQKEVYKAWEGLGYYSRARNLHASAKYIAYDLDGEFPSSYDEILKLKGVGPYTAAAIASFAFDEDKAVLDGNVFRVLSRLFDIDTDILSSKGEKEFAELANTILVKGKAAEYNQAIMDFGALLCKPKNPDCLDCPLNEKCISYANNTISERPVKKKAKLKTKRFFHYLVFIDPERNLLLNKRTESDIWEGLYEFPLVETNSDKKLQIDRWEQLVNLDQSPFDVSHKIEKQTLSHQIITAVFYIVKMDKNENLAMEDGEKYNLDSNSHYFYIETKELKNYAFPKIINSFLETADFFY